MLLPFFSEKFEWISRFKRNNGFSPIVNKYKKLISIESKAIYWIFHTKKKLTFSLQQWNEISSYTFFKLKSSLICTYYAFINFFIENWNTQISTKNTPNNSHVYLQQTSNRRCRMIEIKKTNKRKNNSRYHTHKTKQNKKKCKKHVFPSCIIHICYSSHSC